MRFTTEEMRRKLDCGGILVTGMESVIDAAREAAGIRVAGGLRMVQFSGSGNRTAAHAGRPRTGYGARALRFTLLEGGSASGIFGRLRSVLWGATR